MRRFIVVMLLAAAGGGWFFFQKFRVEGLNGISVKQRTPDVPAPATGDEVASAAGTVVPFARQGNTIRIASFDIQAFGPTKLGKPLVMKTLVDLLRRFDVIALQEIRSPRDDQLPRLIEMLNAPGAGSQAGKPALRHYDFVIGPRQGPDEAEEQFAFVFDAASVSVDRSTVYTVDDPGRRMERDPLVASFQVRGPKDDEAFTFTLVDVRVAAERASQELTALAEVCRAVRSVSVQGRLEDDILLLGNFNADDRHLGLLGPIAEFGQRAIVDPDEHSRHEDVRQYRVQPPGDDRVHRPLRGGRSDARFQPVDEPGAGSVRPSADLGRVQHLRRWPGRAYRGAAERFRAEITVCGARQVGVHRRLAPGRSRWCRPNGGTGLARRPYLYC